MAAKVSFKSMDYFKYRKYIIDKDDPSSCSKEVTSLCACVQTLNMRDDKFDEGDDEWGRLEEVFGSYKQILGFKRVETVDVRLKSGWWGDQKSGLSVGKVRPPMLKEVLVAKCKDWNERHGVDEDGGGGGGLERGIEGSGVFVFKHKEKGCFQEVFSCSDNIFTRCAELFKSTFDATVYTPLSSLLVISLVNDWDFYFIPSESNVEVLKVLENDTILKHDTLWPHGLNLVLSIETPFDVKHFRESCVRHNWPPERVCRPAKIQSIDPGKLRIDTKRLKSQPPTLRSPIKSTASPNSPPGRPKSARPNSTGVASASSPKSPMSSRPATAHPKCHKADEKASNGISRKETTETKKQAKTPSKQETNSLREKRTSRSFQNFKKDNSINDMQSVTKNDVKLQGETLQKLNGKCKQGEVRSETKKPETEEKVGLETSNEENYKQNIVKNDENKEDDDFFEPKPMKRSNTFTLSDTEDEQQTPSNNQSTLTPRAVMAAKQLS